MPRFLPILGAFALGCLVTWSTTRPATAPVSDRPDARVAAPAAEPAVVGGSALRESVVVGVPPASVTPAKPNAQAGQRRALARAVGELEQHPPDIPSRDMDPEAAARFADQFTAALAKGDSR